MTSTPFFEGFLDEYESLKRLTDDEPKNVQDRRYHNVEFQNIRRRLRTRSNILSCIRPINLTNIVPDEFPAALNDYNKRYKNKMNQEPRIIQIKEDVKESGQRDAHIENEHDYFFDSYYRTPEEVLSAISDFLSANGFSPDVKLWDDEWVDSILVSSDKGKGEPISRNGAKAYKYVCDVFLRDGLDKIFERLKKLGHVYVPQSVANKHGDEFNSFLNLLNEACRAYILGLPLSTISISRAVVDRLLPVDDGKEKADLRDRIRETGWLDSSDKDKLQKIRMLANDILHGTRSGKPKSYTEDEIEKKALECLGYLKRIIQRVAKAPI